MNNKLVYVAFSVFVLIDVINVAKSSESSSNSSSPNVESIPFFEGGSLSKPSRIIPRKGVTFENTTKTTDEHEDNENSKDSDVIPVVTNSSSIFNNVTAITSSTNMTQSSISTTMTSRKPPKKKPTITISADDSPHMIELEKNINYTKIETLIDPKTSSLSDRTIVGDENRTRRNYILYMGLAFALPMTFTLIHFSYKKIRNWMEIRHYQRVVSESTTNECY